MGSILTSLCLLFPFVLDDKVTLGCHLVTSILTDMKSLIQLSQFSTSSSILS